MIHLVTFADESMARSADKCIGSGSRNGFDKLNWFDWESFRKSNLYRENEALFTQRRGLGFWAWKPAILDRAFSNHTEADVVYSRGVQDGDIVVYADAGVEFINNVNHIIERMDQDIFLFGNNWEHKFWCKRDIAEAVWPERCGPSISPRHEWEMFGKQVQASVIFFRVSDYTRKFVAEWLKWCLFECGRLIDDSPSRTPNHPEFQENRHDQAILTTLAYREGIKLHWWPASYNDGAFTYEKLPVFASDNYPVMFNHHRKRNHEWENAA